MKTREEIIKLLNFQNGFVKEILFTTEKIFKDIVDKDINKLSTELNKRQGLFVRVKEIHDSVQPTLRAWREKNDVPNQVTRVVNQSREIMKKILELDTACQEVGEEFKNTLADRVNKARTSKKISEGYAKSSRSSSRFLSGRI